MSYSSIPKQLFACQIWETNYSADVNIFQKWIIKFGYNGKTHDLKEKHENMLGGKGGFFLLEICDNNNLNWKVSCFHWPDGVLAQSNLRGS